MSIACFSELLVRHFGEVAESQLRLRSRLDVGQPALDRLLEGVELAGELLDRSEDGVFRPGGIGAHRSVGTVNPCGKQTGRICGGRGDEIDRHQLINTGHLLAGLHLALLRRDERRGESEELGGVLGRVEVEVATRVRGVEMEIGLGLAVLNTEAREEADHRVDAARAAAGVLVVLLDEDFASLVALLLHLEEGRVVGPEVVPLGLHSAGDDGDSEDDALRAVDFAARSVGDEIDGAVGAVHHRTRHVNASHHPYA